MWFEEYEKLSDYEKEEFRRVSNMLLSKNFILRYKLDRREKVSRTSHDYNFCERYWEIFRGYLKIAGWEFIRDNSLGVIQLYNRYDSNHIKLDKNTTLILFVLRLIYDEEREKVSLSREIMTSISDIIEKMRNIGVIEKRKISDKDIQSAFSFFKNHNILDKIDGSWKDPNTRILIYPTILFVISNEKINEIYEMTQESDLDDSYEIEIESALTSEERD